MTEPTLVNDLSDVPNLKLEDFIDRVVHEMKNTPLTLAWQLGVVRVEIHQREKNLDDVLLAARDPKKIQRLQEKSRRDLFEARERIDHHLKNWPS